MMIPKHGLLAAARLRRSVPGLRRVIVARADGIAMYDDVPLERRDGGAALTAAVLGLAATASAGFELGVLRAATAIGDDGVLVVAPVDAAHVLGVIADPHADLVALTREVSQEAERLREAAGPVRVSG